jgi:DNA replication protein DnaC
MNTAMLSHLKDLKLSGVIKTLDTRLEEAIKSNLSYLEFFELLVQDEVNNRIGNANRKRLQKAKFRQHKTIEEFNFLATSRP